MRDRRQRRDCQGRHLLPDDGQKAPACAGSRVAESAALHLSGGFRGRLPAAPRRGVPRPRAFRAHLLQPGHHERQGHSAGGRGAGFVHGGRRLRAGDERRGSHRARAGHDLPRRSTTGQGRHRRDRLGRGAGRRRPTLARLRRHRPPCRGRRARAADRPVDRGHLRPARARPMGSAPFGRAQARHRRSSTMWCRRTRGCPTTCTR